MPGGSGGAGPGSAAQCPLPVPLPSPAGPCPAALGRERRFPRPTPCVDFPGAAGRFPRGFFARRMRRQRQAKICFYGRSLWDDPGPVCVTPLGPPARRWPRLGRATPRPEQPRGKRPRKETFPSLIVLPLAERVMKILGKCYTTRGYPFGAKRPEKPGRFPGGEGRCLGATLSPGKHKRILNDPAALSPLPGPPKPEPENNITRLWPQTRLSPLQCYKKHLN